MPRYHSQIGQDWLLDRAVFCGMRDGVFVEVGAADGLLHSNTLMFERDRGWTGLLIEPNPSAFVSIVEHRRATALNIGISGEDGVFPFQVIHGAPAQLSGFVGAPDERILLRIDREVVASGAVTETLPIRARRLPDVLEENGLREVHYLSIDTQGEEPRILRSLRESSALVHVISVECNYRSDRAGLVAAAGPDFVPIMRHRFDLFLINRTSPFWERRWALRAAKLHWELRHRITKMKGRGV